jgi:enoyl-CoA hydratase/carnithine racemase
VVGLPDPGAAAARLAELAATSPQAFVVAAQVLRQSEQLDVRAGLAAEASAYSMLLAGGEFSTWLTRRRDTRAGIAVGEPEAEVRVGVQREGTTLRITLQRPDRRNAMDRALREALVEALSVAAADPTLAVRLGGAGPDFCSGGDLDEFGTATDLVAAYLVRLDRQPGWLLHRIRDRVTVQLHGACIGAGIEMPAFAGRVIADPSAYFELPEVAMGLIPGAGGTVSIPRRIGRWRAAWLALSGARLDAETALAWGLVDEVLGT